MILSILSLEHIFIHPSFLFFCLGFLFLVSSPEIFVSMPISVHFICVAVAASELSHTDIKSIPSLNKLFYVIWHPGLCSWGFLGGVVLCCFFGWGFCLVGFWLVGLVVFFFFVLFFLFLRAFVEIHRNQFSMDPAVLAIQLLRTSRNLPSHGQEYTNFAKQS